MATVSRESLGELMAERRAQFAALEASGQVTPEMSAFCEGLFALLQMLVTLLLEKRTRRTPANSDLPGSLAPFDRTAPAKAGAKGKGPKHARGECASARVEVERQASAVDQCRRCGEDLSSTAAEDHERRILVDIEFVTKETRIDAEIKRCPSCAEVNRGPFPDSMPAPLQYGSGIIAFAADLLISQMVPLRRAAQLLRMISGRQVSEAALLKWAMRAHRQLAAWEAAAVERLLGMPVLHADETSIRVDRRNHWIHSCSGGGITVKRRHRKRGAEALEAIGIIPRHGDRGSGDEERPKPALVHDRWATYFMYDRCDHALCGAHLLRNLKRIEEALDHRWAKRMRQLLLEVCKEVSDSKDNTLSQVRFEEVTERYRAILADGRQELPARPARAGSRGRLPKSEAEKLHDALARHEDAVLRFAERSEVPFTNNAAERSIRMAKVKQKVSGTFRNADCADACCRISSYLQSMSCQGFGSLAAMQIALNGKAVEMLAQSE